MDIYFLLHVTPCRVNIRFCKESTFLLFSSAKVFGLLISTLVTKVGCLNNNISVKHHNTAQADENFLLKMLKGKNIQKRTKNVQNRRKKRNSIIYSDF